MGVFIVSKIRYILYDQMDARTAPLLISKTASVLKRSCPIAPFFNTYADMRIEMMASMRC
ncbi:MAG TPA: hypothetical protein VI584_08320 [Nitrospiria bacterium]|nr:hypothetical protein [Nitrospiria bacterium]